MHYGPFGFARLFWQVLEEIFMSDSTFKLKVLGAGDWKTTSERHPACFMLSVGKKKILLDCGFGAMHQMAHYGISPLEIDEVWITHFHPDHFSDVIPFLVHRTLEANASGVAQPPLMIRGPEGIEERIGTLFSVFCADAVRDPAMDIWDANSTIVGIGPGTTLHMVPVHHIPGHESAGFSVTYQGRSFFYAGDACAPLEGQPRLFQEALNCDTILLSAGATKTAGGHIDFETAMNWIQSSNVKRLILNHVPEQSFGAAQDYARGATTTGRLQVVIARDGDGYDL